MVCLLKDTSYTFAFVLILTESGSHEYQVEYCVEVSQSYPQVALTLSKAGHGTLADEDILRIKWDPTANTAKYVNEAFSAALDNVWRSFQPYNENRAVDYARQFLHRRARGGLIRDIPAEYSFAMLTSFMRAFPALEAGREFVEAKLSLFGVRVVLPDHPTLHMRLD